MLHTGLHVEIDESRRALDADHIGLGLFAAANWIRILLQ